jgi:VHL beta domain
MGIMPEDTMPCAKACLCVAALAVMPGLANASCALGTLTSGNSDVAQTVSFSNQSGTESLRLIWIDFDGSPVSYAEVAPGTEVIQPTFSGHVWAIETASGLCKAVIVVESDLALLIG